MLQGVHTTEASALSAQLLPSVSKQNGQLPARPRSAADAAVSGVSSRHAAGTGLHAREPAQLRPLPTALGTARDQKPAACGDCVLLLREEPTAAQLLFRLRRVRLQRVPGRP